MQTSCSRSFVFALLLFFSLRKIGKTRARSTVRLYESPHDGSKLLPKHAHQNMPHTVCNVRSY